MTPSSNNNKKGRSMLNRINWECTGDGASAELKRPSLNPAISRSYADGLVKSLMHDVVSLSAVFEGEDTITFGRCAEVSVFGKTSAEFYGLYMSSTPGTSPDYCLRHCHWNGGFKDLDSLLAGLSAATVFFSSATLEEPYKEVVEKLDSLNNEEGDIAPLLPQKLELGNSRINYFVADQNKTSMRSYRRGFASNERVEKLFDDFGLMHRALNARQLISPLAATFKILYSSDCYSRVFDRNS